MIPAMHRLHAHRAPRGTPRVLAAVLPLALLLAGAAPVASQPRILSPQAAPPPRYVLDIAVESRQELVALLQRAEALSSGYGPGAVASIALVLHGPELRYFDLRELEANREVIELASRLDARRVIDIKACQRMLEGLGMGREHLPGFIELVPFGPDEIRRLAREGYVVI